MDRSRFNKHTRLLRIDLLPGSQQNRRRQLRSPGRKILPQRTPCLRSQPLNPPDNSERAGTLNHRHTIRMRSPQATTLPASSPKRRLIESSWIVSLLQFRKRTENTNPVPRIDTKQLPVHRQRRPPRHRHPDRPISQGRRFHKQLRSLTRRYDTHGIKWRRRDRSRPLQGNHLDTHRCRLFPGKRPQIVTSKPRPATLMPPTANGCNGTNKRNSPIAILADAVQSEPAEQTSTPDQPPRKQRTRSPTIQSDPCTERRKNNN